MAEEQSDARQRPRPIVPTLTPTAYRVLLSTSYFLWGSVLVVFGYTGKFFVYVKRDDLLSVIQTTAGLAALALAILTYLHETASRDRYMKLVLAGLTFLFMVATTTGFLGALTYAPTDEFRKLVVHFLVLGYLYIGAALSAPLGLLLVKIGVLRERAAQYARAAYDYSLFVAAGTTFVTWSSETSLASVTVVVTTGAMIVLLCSCVVLLVSVWRVRSHQEGLQEQLLEALKNERRRHQEGNSSPRVVSLEYLRNRLGSNDDTLLEAIDALRSDDRIVIVKVGYDRGYYVLEPSDWQGIVAEILSHEAVVLSTKFDDRCWELFLVHVEERTHLPRQCLREYFGERIREYVSTTFRDSGKVTTSEGRQETELRLFLKADAFQRLSGAIKAEIRQIVREHGVRHQQRMIGQSVLVALSCLPLIPADDYYYSTLREHIGSLVRDQGRVFVDESDRKSCESTLDELDVLVGDEEQVLENVSLEIGLPYEIVEKHLKGKILRKIDREFTVFTGRVSIPHFGACRRLTIRTRALEGVRNESLGRRLRVLPGLPDSQYDLFSAWLLKQITPA